MNKRRESVDEVQGHPVVQTDDGMPTQGGIVRFRGPAQLVLDHAQRRHGVVTPDQVKKLEDEAARLNENDLAELWGDTQEHVRQAISAGLDSLEHSAHLIRPDAAVELMWTLDAATGEFVALWRVPCEPQLSAH